MNVDALTFRDPIGHRRQNSHAAKGTVSVVNPATAPCHDETGAVNRSNGDGGKRTCKGIRNPDTLAPSDHPIHASAGIVVCQQHVQAELLAQHPGDGSTHRVRLPAGGHRRLAQSIAAAATRSVPWPAPRRAGGPRMLQLVARTSIERRLWVDSCLSRMAFSTKTSRPVQCLGGCQLSTKTAADGTLALELAIQGAAVNAKPPSGLSHVAGTIVQRLADDGLLDFAKPACHAGGIEHDGRW